MNKHQKQSLEIDARKNLGYINKNMSHLIIIIEEIFADLENEHPDLEFINKRIKQGIWCIKNARYLLKFNKRLCPPIILDKSQANG